MRIELRRELELVARRFRHVRLWGGLAFCWLSWALIGVAVRVVGSRPGNESLLSTNTLATLAALAGVSGLVAAFLALRSARDRRWVARQIEAKHPELATGLLAAVEEDAVTPPAEMGYLQTAVIRSTLAKRKSQPWEDTVPGWRLRAADLAHAFALGLLLLSAAALLKTRTESAPESFTPIAWSDAKFDIQVEPGNTALEKGTTLLVVAHFNGAVPPDADLVFAQGKDAEGRRPMSRSLDDPKFAGRVDAVMSDLTYRIDYANRASETFHVNVFEYPELLRTDAKLVFPGYTSQDPKTVEDIRHVTAVEGTELTLLCRLNKEVAIAKLVAEDGQEVRLEPQENGSVVYQTRFVLSDPRRFKVHLVDLQGRANKVPAELVINVTRNRPPIVTMTQPARDVRVSPVEELKLKAKLEDDYGVVRHGLSFAMGGEEPRDIVLHSPEKTKKTLQAEHLLDFEGFKAVPDQLVTYFFWAEDIGPDNQPRRTSGDMFFAEVRHFEEIFRQGEQPPSGSSENEQQGEGNAQASEKLAELQKEVINATWRLIRRETRPKPSEQFAEDSKLIKESQHTVLEQADELAERLQDSVSKKNLEQAQRFMKEAEKHLTETTEKLSIPTLRPALASEQAAYQALLKLRAREFEVIRNNSRQRQQGGRSANGGPSQRQLNQLELSNEENRYEEQRSARSQQNQSQREREQRENRQVVNRLKELAQRQADLNERVKELQASLEAAKTPQAREELERQLKRLREQQQQVLRDTDELRERMESEENQQRMAEARQQMEQSREHVRQASEALEQGRLAQAVTEGARAGQQLNDLKEDLRKKASDRFTQEMTEMRKDARQLDEDQKRLSEQLDALNHRNQRNLRDSGERKGIQEGLGQQEKKLDKLVDRMRDTVQDAEEPEPLLAKELYDTVRKTTEQQVPDALKVAEQLVDAGVTEDAAKLSRKAGDGIEQLRQGVEKAARSVLGDETAALKRAQAELEDLANQVNREIARGNGRDENEPGRGARDPQNGQDNADEAQAKDQQARAGQDDAQQKRQGRPTQRGQQGERNQQGERGQQQGQNPQAGEPNQEGQQGQPGQQGEQQGQQGQRGNQPGQRGQQGGRNPQAGQPNDQGQEGDAGQPGERQGQEGQQGQGGNQPGQQGQGGNQPGQQGQRGNQPGQLRGQQGRQTRGVQRGGGGGNGVDRLLDGFNNTRPGNPIMGEGFREWSDRMRDVEELLDNPELRAETARIRDRVRGAREEFKRHSKVPDWTKLQEMVADPIRELRDRVAEEVRKRESPDSLVPIDRDPVPPRFTEGVRKYYERLGGGR